MDYSVARIRNYDFLLRLSLSRHLQLRIRPSMTLTERLRVIGHKRHMMHSFSMSMLAQYRLIGREVRRWERTFG